MKVLVTGSNGFVGSHIVQYLAGLGHEVTCLVRATSDCRWINGLDVSCVTGDIEDPRTLQDAVRAVDVIVHAAALVRANTPEEYFAVNAAGTRNLARAVLQNNPSLKQFILISSQAAMGPSPALRPKLISETNTPVSDYGRSKLAGELELIRTLEGTVPYTILRPTSVYGPRDKDILIFFQLINLGLRPKTSDQRFIQLLYVDDIPVAVERAMSLPAARNKIYCLGEPAWRTWPHLGEVMAIANDLNTRSIPVPDWAFTATSFVAETIARISGKPAVLNRQKIEEMRQRFWIADVTAAVSELGMDFTNLSRGAKITYQWYKENKWL